MSRVRLRLIFPGIMGVAVLAALALSRPAAGPEAGVFIPHDEQSPDTMTVHFSDNIPRDQWDEVVAAYGAELESEMLVDGFAVISVPEEQRREIGEALAASGVVKTVEEITYRYPTGLPPNDPLWAEKQWNMRLVTADDAWNVSQGNGVRVAVVDTGVAYENFAQFAQAPDLAGTSFADPFDFFDNDSHANDDYGHGTHVAGTIAQTTNNNYGAAGIAYNAIIIPVKVCGDDPQTAAPYECATEDIANGIIWATDHGAKVINLSLGSSKNVTDAERQALEYARNANVVVVAAAGNSGGANLAGRNSLDYPAAVSSVMAVSAGGFLGSLAYYSNYGVGEPPPGGGGNTLVDVIAPGGNPPIENSGGTVVNPNNEGLTSVVSQETYAYKCNGGTEDFSAFDFCGFYGTSMAAAHVSGVAALIRSAYPALSRTQVRTVIQCSAEDVGAPGIDSQSGYGLLQAHAAVRDTDGDKLPDCIDSSPFTPTPIPPPTPTPTSFPTPFQPPNQCLATPTPSPTPTLTPTPTATLSGSETPSPSVSDTPTPAASGAGVAGSPPPTDTPSPTPTDTPSPTDTPPPTETPTDTPPPTDTPSPTPTESATTPGNESPTPTPTATPTATPSTSPGETPAPTTPYIACGDVNCDSVVDAHDALEIMRYMAFVPGPPACIGKGYVNCDAALNQIDALVILRYKAQVPLGIPQSCQGIG